MSLKKTIAGSLVLSLGLTTVMASPAVAKSISELQNEQNSVNNSIEKKKEELNNTSTQKSETVAKMKEINDSINATEKKIAAFSTQISDQQVNIDETNAQIAETEKKLAKAQSDLNNRLVNIYKEGNINYLEVLFQSEDFSDFLTRFEYLSFISKRDKDLVDEVSATKAQLDNQKATLEQQLQSLNALKAEEEGVKGLLQEQQATQKSVYAELEKDEAAIKENIAVMQATSAEIGNQIVALQQQAAAQQAAQQQAAGSGATVAPSTGNIQNSAAGGGVWPAPASRIITSTYGGRAYPIDGSYNFHLGLDIGAGYGTPVVAYQGGTVIIATYHWSYGNYVVVDHGNGLSTLYAHMSALNVSAGSKVSAGQQVGAVGSTGSSTGPHLHFEVRINGSTVDPAPYLGI
jgi:murein DD-endopeptidase MepM/ murein hydrolase activator NlpD